MDSEAFDRYRQKIQYYLEKLHHLPGVVSPSDEQCLVGAIEQLETTLKNLDSTVNSPTLTKESLSPPPLSFSPPSLDFLHLVSEAHVITTPQGIIQLANSHAAKLLNQSQQELANLPLTQFIQGNEHIMVQNHLNQLESGSANWEWEMWILPNNRPACLVSCTISPLRDPHGKLVAVHWLLHDLNERLRIRIAEDLVQDIGEQVLEGLTLSQSLTVICQRLAETFGYPLVWIGRKEVNGGITILAHAGGQSHFLDHHGERWDHTNEGQGPGGRAIRTQKTQRFLKNDPDYKRWAESIGSYGFQSGVAAPMCVRENVLGVLTVYSQQPDAFDPGVIRWLEKLSAQISMTLFMPRDYEHLRLQGAAVSSAEFAVCITDHRGCIEWINDAYSRLTGFSAAEIVGGVLPSFDMNEMAGSVECLQDKGQCWRKEFVAQRKEGSAYTVEQMITPLFSVEGKVTNFVAIQQDITKRKEIETRLAYLAHHDPLTDLPNRAMFQDRLSQALAQALRRRRYVAIMFLDLDQFKGVNDEFGHETGDVLLKTVAERLTQCVRVTDTVARLSGDEFTLILQDIEQVQYVQNIAHKILACVSQPLAVGRQTLSPRCSLGVAISPIDGNDLNDLLQLADQAMYKAKQRGGQCCHFVSPLFDSPTTVT